MKSERAAFIVLALGVLLAPLAAKGQQAAPSVMLRLEDTDIQTVIKAVSSLTGITFLYDPEKVRGRITLLTPKSIPPAEALELLKSALALHGYRLLSRAEGMWVVPTVRVGSEAMAVKVVPLRYARAAEVAYALFWIAPPGVRVVPYYPTNSLIFSGPPAAVEELIDVIRPSAQD
jgi:general secretion pathway protein D